MQHARTEVLNLPGHYSTAAIASSLKLNKDRTDAWVHLSISDCTKALDFDFDLTNEEGQKNAVHKLSTLIEVLSELQTAVIDVSKEINDNRRAEESNSGSTD